MRKMSNIQLLAALAAATFLTFGACGKDDKGGAAQGEKVAASDKKEAPKKAKDEAAPKADEKKAAAKKPADEKKAADKKPADEAKADTKKPVEAPKDPAAAELAAAMKKEAAGEKANPEKKAEAPAAGEKKAEAPAAGEKKAEAPAAGKKAEAPAGEKKAEAPAAGEKKAEAPAGEKKAEAPAGEKKAEAPAAGAKAGKAVAAATAPATKEAPKAPVAAKPKVDAKPGPAYFGLYKMGLVKLEDGKFTSLGKRPDSFKSMIAAPDGTLYVTAFTGVWAIKPGKKGKKIGNYRKTGGADHLAVAPDGTLWTASYKGVAQYKGGKWTLEEKSKLGADVKLLKGIAVDPEGNVWVVSSNAVHKRDKTGAWTSPEVGQGKLFYDSVSFAADGTGFFGYSSGLLKYAGGKFTKIQLGFRPVGMRQLQVAANGTVVARTFREIVVVTPDGKATRYSSKKGSMKGRQIDAIALDAQGRVWASTDHGVAVIADGKVSEWASGSVPEIAGSLRQLVVLGAGPTLPKVGPVKTGKVTGKVVKGGEPVAGAQIEICKQPSSYFKGSPCAEAPWKAAGKTGADGTFTFSDVPLNTYRFAIKAGEAKWATGYRECCMGMKPGKAFDAGTIKLRK